MRAPASDLHDRAAAQLELEMRLARRDFAAFVAQVFGFALAEHHRRWCSAVESQSRVLVFAPIEHGKTSVISIAYPLFVLGRNPDARIAIISETATQATRILAAVREHVMRNERLHAVFPKLRPAGGARTKWSDSEIIVERPSTGKDPSIIAIGVHGPLLGARLDVAILDDVLSFESTFTSAQREKTISWFRSTLVGRIVAGGKVLVAGTAWHNEDLLHTVSASGEYVTLRDAAIKADGTPLWPERWPLERLEQRRREIGELEFSRQLLVQAIADGDSRFRSEWIDHAFTLARTEGCTLVDSYTGPCRTFTGVDLAVGTSDKHDETAIFTIALLPGGRRRVLALDAGRWTAPEIVERIRTAHARYRSVVRVETNGAQDYVRQFLATANVPVEAHATGRNKNDPAFGIESIAVELEQGLWIVPDAPATRAWARELIVYSPSQHAGDRLIASWLAREAARSNEGGAPIGPVAGVSVFERDDGEEDPETWVLGSSKPSLPLLPYRGLRDRGLPVGGGGTWRPSYRVR